MSHKRSLEICVDAWTPRTQGWVAFAGGSETPEQGGIALSLVIGSTRLGGLARTIPRADVDGHSGYQGPPKGFDVPLAAIGVFAALMGRTAAIVVEGDDAPVIERSLPAPERLAGKAGLLEPAFGLTIVDIWFATSRRVILRYEGAPDRPFRVRAFQSPVDVEAPIVGLPSRVTGAPWLGTVEIDLVNPFLPLLIVLTDGQGDIIGAAVMPFPSFARNGLHHAEARLASAGGEGLNGVMSRSDILVQGIFDRRSGNADGSGFLDAILFDPSACAGTEPMLDPDLLTALEVWLHIPFILGTPERAADENGVTSMFRKNLRAPRDFPLSSGQSALVLPHDAVPTFGVLLDPLVLDPSLPADFATASYLTLLDAGREVWLVDPGPLKGDIARAWDLVPAILTAANEGPRRVAAWPLAIRTPAAPTRFEDTGIFAISLDSPERTDIAVSVAGVPLSILIASSPTGEAPVDLFQSLAAQVGFDQIQILYSAVGGPAHDAAQTALEALFPGQHRTIVHAERMSRSHEFRAVAGFASHQQLILLGSETILHDPMSLAILASERMRVGADVLAASLVRPHGHALAFASAGYFLREINYRGVPTLLFDMPDARRILPTTYAVIAAVHGAVAIDRNFLMGLGLTSSQHLQPTVDEVCFGLDIARQGSAIQVSTRVNVTTTRADLGETSLTIALPLVARSGLIELITRYATALQKL